MSNFDNDFPFGYSAPLSEEAGRLAAVVRGARRGRPWWLDAAIDAAWKNARSQLEQELARQESIARFRRYADDPLGFIEGVLGWKLTEDIKRVVTSVVANPVTIARSANAVGKSHGAANIALWWFMCLPEAKVFLTAAPPVENLRNILWGEIIRVIRRHAHIFKGVRRKRMNLYNQWDENNFIATLTIPTTGSSEEKIAKFSGKHGANMLFIVDEGDAVPEEVYIGIESCMSGGNARLLIMYNPKSQSGPVYQREVERRANVIQISALNHPNVISGKDIIPGAVSREITVRRINEWTTPIPPQLLPQYMADENERYNVFHVPEFLVGYQARSQDGGLYQPLQAGARRIRDPQFHYTVLGQYPAQSINRMIRDEWIEAAVTRWKQYVEIHGENWMASGEVRPIIGLDTAEYGSDANVLVARYGGFVAMPRFWSGIDPDRSADEALRLCLPMNPEVVIVDGTGVGSSIAPAMSRRARAMGKDLRTVSLKVGGRPMPHIRSEIGSFAMVRDQLWWMLARWLEKDPTAMIPPDHALIEELKAVSYEVKNGNIRVTPKEQLRRILRRSPDRADALCLTFMPFERARFVKVGGRR